MRLLKWTGKALLTLIVIVIVGAAGLLGYLSLTEYKPDDVEPVQVTEAARKNEVTVGKMLTVVTCNTGYGGLDRDADFFMDGGKGIRPESKAKVEQNISGVLSALTQQNADIYLLQEVDRASSRSYDTDEAAYYQHGLSLNMAYASNYRCGFVPFPWPPIGRVESGLATYTTLRVTEATRESLPVPFRWPVRVANLKRCLLIERVPVADSDKELVIVNLHLEAYDDGEGKVAQTKQLMNILATEYRNGNYVIAGGDFNQTFEGAAAYPLLNSGYWQPGSLSNAELPVGLRYLFDATRPTCRLLNAPYDGDRERSQFYVIDGFIVSDNLKVNHVETVDLNFKNTDHNPVILQVTPV